MTHNPSPSLFSSLVTAATRRWSHGAATHTAPANTERGSDLIAGGTMNPKRRISTTAVGEGACASDASMRLPRVPPWHHTGGSLDVCVSVCVCVCPPTYLLGAGPSTIEFTPLSCSGSARHRTGRYRTPTFRSLACLVYSVCRYVYRYILCLCVSLCVWCIAMPCVDASYF